MIGEWPVLDWRRLTTSVLLSLLVARPAPAGEAWPQWRGPRRDGTTDTFRPPARWPDALERVWRSEVGGGHASPVVAGGRVFVFSREDGREVLRALDLATGEQLWTHSALVPYDPAPEAAEHGSGPFSTPTVAEGRVYTFGIDETLSAHDADDGRLLWRRRYDDEFAVTRPLYGTSLSPLVTDGRVVVYVGGPEDGALVALDGETGETAWSLEGDGPPYGSPVVADLAGVRQVVTLSQRRLIGVHTVSGRLLWERPFPVEWDNTTATPIVAGGTVLLSSYGVGVHALRPERHGVDWKVKTVWHTRQVSTFLSNPVLVDGVLYGFSHFRKGQLFALDARDGTLLWTSPGRMADNAYLVHANGWLLVLDDRGTLIVVHARPDAFQPATEYSLSEEPVWAHPAVLGEHVLVKGRTAVTLWRIEDGSRHERAYPGIPDTTQGVSPRPRGSDTLTRQAAPDVP